MCVALLPRRPLRIARSQRSQRTNEGSIELVHSGSMAAYESSFIYPETQERLKGRIGMRDKVHAIVALA